MMIRGYIGHNVQQLQQHSGTKWKGRQSASILRVVRNVVAVPNSVGPSHYRQRRRHQLYLLMLLLQDQFKLEDSMHVIAATVAVNRKNWQDALGGKVFGVHVVAVPGKFR